MKHWNKVELRRLLGNAERGAVTRSEEEEWIRDTWKQRQEKKTFTFAVEALAEKKLIGGTGLFNIDWTSRTADVGISIYDPEYWGRGYGKEALDLLLGFAFQDLNMNRVGLEVFDFNQRAHRCYLKVGFKDVGRRRKVRFIEGQYHDSILMDLLREEWRRP